MRAEISRTNADGVERGDGCADASANIQAGELRARRKRVCFIDEAGSSPQRQHRRGLVTSTAYRPPTTSEERRTLYYTSQDYALFALEDHYHQLEMIQRSRTKVFSWEDFVVYESRYDDEIAVTEEEEEEEEAREVAGAM
eukprot:CAMPEP_0172565024 /NCGR_PEP_ID=MMETSP1067-20121228/106649_1 /TAXON_ID=265564 ORGANISM="Thalassiosira punctigera, Strain Tpunct2005C2" /NCGR_SAMPLE_ID=MMETSP1067 /ASSEMBLY_ACC=CAM_ASM_000444 /LENGTH=139 /DNA_ID=CAMNT_0013355829 /DNA_START=21 /DNA_END=437 /DNA_ORIENTATION=-